MAVYASLVMYSTTPVEVNTQGEHRDGIVAVRFGGFDGGRLVVQGDPEVMLALFDRVRSELVAAVGATWPVGSHHDEHAAVTV